MKAAVHRHAPDGWELKSATVIREPDGRYYCSVLYRCPDPPPPLPLTPGRSLIWICSCPGALCMDSGGTVYAFPDGYGAAVERYHKARAAMEGKRGSRNGQTPSNHYRKLEKKAAGLRRHADDMLRDALHRLSHSLAGRYEIICAADGNPHMADGSPYEAADTGCPPVQEKLSSLSGRSYTQLLDMLEYKQRRRGHLFIRVDAEDLPADSTGRQGAVAIQEAGMRRLSEGVPPGAQD
ncbi:MAG: hypothetical protein LUI12_07860 [Clostridiales bacterium]|nr:hypothetical protein [Clostridiales bacterium]